MPNTRREALDNYIRAVVGDMIARGVIRQQRGWSIASILQKEGPKVAAEVMADLEHVLTSVGSDFVRGAASMLESAAKRQLERVAGGIGGFLKNELEGLFQKPSTKKR